MCWKYSTWWRPLIWVFKDFLSQTQPTGISSFTPDQVNNNSKFWKHLGSTFPAVNWGAKPLQLHQTYFAALSLIQKLHLAKKLSKNGLFCQQQGLKQSTDGYAGLPLPTRWSMQRCKYKGKRSSKWVTNYSARCYLNNIQLIRFVIKLIKLIKWAPWFDYYIRFCKAGKEIWID